MLSPIQSSLKKIFSTVIQPDAWTLDEPNPVKGRGGLGQPGKWGCTMQEIPVLSQKIKRHSQPGELVTEYILQYRAVFRFPGNLNYHDLPMRPLADITEYLTFLIQTHPDLLLMTPAQIDGITSLPPQKTDPCLYQPPSSDIQKDLSVGKLMVNSFIPVVELDGSKDWLVTLVWSIEVSVEGSILAYRRYFEQVLGSGSQLGSQIAPNHNLTGGLVPGGTLAGPVQIYEVGLGVFERSPSGDTPAYSPNPSPLDP